MRYTICSIPAPRRQLAAHLETQSILRPPSELTDVSRLLFQSSLLTTCQRGERSNKVLGCVNGPQFPPPSPPPPLNLTLSGHVPFKDKVPTNASPADYARDSVSYSIHPPTARQPNETRPWKPLHFFFCFSPLESVGLTSPGQSILLIRGRRTKGHAWN